jgi:hypothetical protein
MLTSYVSGLHRLLARIQFNNAFGHRQMALGALPIHMRTEHQHYSVSDSQLSSTACRPSLKAKLSVL